MTNIIKPIKGFTGALIGVTLGGAALGISAGLTGATRAVTQMGISLGVTGNTIGQMGQFLKFKKP